MTTMLVASIGGHLTQLHMLRESVGDGPVVWVTNDSPQSRSLLEGEDVEFVPYVGPRDLRTASRLLGPARAMIRRRAVDRVVSTGSAIAVPFLVAAASRRRTAIYVESATRSDGPSLTGRILSAVPGVEVRTQHRGWAGRRWKFHGSSLIDMWTSEPGGTDRVGRVVVSLGTMQLYGFRSLVDRLIQVLPADVEVLWQVGSTDTTDLDIVAHDVVDADVLRCAMESADVVVAHAGTGIALSALAAGRCPVLVPRRAARNEHVDDHQAQTARHLAAADAAVVCEVDELSWDHLVRAAARRPVLRRPEI